MNGCNAMEQVFHIACFVCISCGKYVTKVQFHVTSKTVNLWTRFILHYSLWDTGNLWFKRAMQIYM